MPRRKIQFVNGGVYHIYNRGVAKCDIVFDLNDIIRFLRSLALFNTTESIGSIFEYDMHMKSKSQKFDKFGGPATKLVEIIAFNILDNHYHLVLKQLVDGGIVKFMHSWSTGYARYFNEKYDRVGSLFQGSFRASPIDEWRMEEIIAYVNLNHVVHEFGGTATKWGMRSSWVQYVGDENVPKILKVKKWKDFDKKKSVEIVNKIKKEREDVKKNEFGGPATK